MHTTLFSNLLTDTQLGDQGTIALDVLLHEVVEQAAALTDHLVQAAAGVVVLRVLLEVLGELSDALGEDSDLNLREPVSPSWVRLASMIAVFWSLSIIV